MKTPALRVLLDDNLPHELRRLLPMYDVQTAAYRGLSGVANGRLLDAAEVAGFDVLLSADQSLPFQQNLARRRLAIVVVTNSKLSVLQANLPALEEALKNAPSGQATTLLLGNMLRTTRGPTMPDEDRES